MSILGNIAETFERATTDLRKIIFGATPEEKEEYKVMAKELNKTSMNKYFSLRDAYEQKNNLQNASMVANDNPIVGYGILLLLIALVLKLFK